MSDDDEELRELAEASEQLLSQQRCDACRKSLPLAPEYFHRDKGKETGFMTTCKECRASQRRKEQSEDIIAKVVELERRGLDLLCDEANSTILEPSPHASTLLEEIMACFGGAQKYAQSLYAHYLCAPPGSSARQKIHQMIVSLTVKVTESGNAQLRTELLSDEELEQEVEKRLMKIHRPRISNAS